jgi:threonine aldolase
MPTQNVQPDDSPSHERRFGAASAAAGDQAVVNGAGFAMNFASDNWAGAHPAIGRALIRHSDGFDAAYGAGELDRVAQACFDRLFGREVAVFFVATGTAANALALASVSRPGGVAFCHRQAHSIADECGATEYLANGARLQGIDGADGKIDPYALEVAIGRFTPDFIHAGQPMAVSVTQATEAGTVYSLDEIAAIAAISRDGGLALHMDGARFANAVVALDTTPAAMADSGVDILSFGATKNGCWCAEALVYLNPALAGQFSYIRKRAGQLHSKSRFIAAQFLAYFEDDLWLENARRANAMAARLAGAVERASRMRLVRRPQANIVFAVADRAFARELRANGVVFYDSELSRDGADDASADEVLVRLVASFATSRDETDAFAALLQ